MFRTLNTVRTIATAGAHAAAEGSAEIILTGALLVAAGCIIAAEKGMDGFRTVRHVARAFSGRRTSRT